MNDIIKIDKGFALNIDENLRYLEEFANREFKFHSGLIFVDKHEFELDNREARKKISDLKNQSWGILEPDITHMFTEKEKLIILFQEFYSTPISDNPDLRNLTPHQLQYIINKLMIRIKRLECVLDTKFNSTEFLEKKSGNRYLMAKGYWINDDGTRVRNISRNITNVESSITELAVKLLKTNKKSVTVMELDKSSGYKPDFTVYDGPKQWFVEVKVKNMNDMVRTYIMFETWKIYREKYKLLT
jgi:hypothetical protein